jgi:hypothetical protein
MFIEKCIFLDELPTLKLIAYAHKLRIEIPLVNVKPKTQTTPNLAALTLTYFFSFRYRQIQKF